REVTKRKHAPTSGSDRLRAIRLPSLRCRSGGRQRRAVHGPTLPCAAVLAAYPLRNTSTRPPVGDPQSELLAGWVVAVASASLLVGRISRRRNPTFVAAEGSAVGLRRKAANPTYMKQTQVQAREPPLSNPAERNRCVEG